jgi:DNA-binding NarL/FixJ family response regulator
VRVILAEDSVLLREGLARLLAEEGHEIVAAVGDGEHLLRAVADGQPDVVVADVRMPPTHTDEGLRAALQIRDRWPAVGILVLSQYVERTYAVQLFSTYSEGVGYLLKDRVADVDTFLDALDRVGSGQAAFDPEVVRQLLARTSHVDPVATLTQRERDVMEKMAAGRTNATIATELFISRSAVEKHINAIFEKLGLNHAEGHHRRVLAVLRYLAS